MTQTAVAESIVVAHHGAFGEMPSRVPLPHPENLVLAAVISPHMNSNNKIVHIRETNAWYKRTTPPDADLTDNHAPVGAGVRVHQPEKPAPAADEETFEWRRGRLSKSTRRSTK